MNFKDKLYTAYFLLHIPTTLLIDSSVVIPSKWQWSFTKTIVDFHVSTNNDRFLVEKPLWLQYFVWWELVFQTPMFCIGAWSVVKQRKHYYPWIVVYAFNALFSTGLCLSYIWFESGLSGGPLINLLGLYVPYVAIPLVMMLDYINRIQLLMDKPKSD